MVKIESIASLQLTGFEMFTRESYFQKFGKPAPPCDPSRRAKSWIGYGTFWFLENGKLGQETVPANENLPNIEGAGPFEKYTIAPSGAWSTLNGQRTTRYNPLYLSLQDDAQALMMQLGGSGLFDAGVANPNDPLSYDETENRREWEFTDARGVVVNVGSLLFLRNMQGVGTAGHWTQSGPVPIWVTDHPVPDSSRPPWSAPCRALAANEKIGPPDFSGLPTVLLDDGQADPNAPTSSGGGFTQGDRNQLATVAQDVATMLQLLQTLAQK